MQVHLESFWKKSHFEPFWSIFVVFTNWINSFFRRWIYNFSNQIEKTNIKHWCNSDQSSKRHLIQLCFHPDLTKTGFLRWIKNSNQIEKRISFVIALVMIHFILIQNHYFDPLYDISHDSITVELSIQMLFNRNIFYWCIFHLDSFWSIYNHFR